jgi:PAS domain S-box-containing protein
MRQATTASRGTATALKASEQLELYRRIFAESADGIAIIDRDGHYVEQNHAHELLTGYSDADLKHQTPAIHLGEEGFQQIAEVLSREGRFRGEMPSRNKQGESRYLDLSAFSVLNASGEPVYFVGIKRDVSNRRRAEEERDARIRELEAVYALTSALNQASRIEDIYEAAMQAIVSAVGVERASILIFDDAGVMRFKAWRGLSDAYRAAVEGHSPWTRDTRDAQPLSVPDVLLDAPLEPYRPTITGEGIRALGFIPLLYEGRLLGKFMLYFSEPHEFTQSELRVAQAIGAAVAIALERRRADEALRRSEQLAAAGRLAASIAHEINNPLAAMTNLVFLLRHRTDDPVSAGYLADLDGELTRVSQITRQTLGFYRDTAAPTNVDVCALLRDTLAVYRPKIAARNARLFVECQDVSVHACSGELRQVLSNVISNAIDACDESSALRISVRASDDRAEIVIADTGHGIAPEHLERIFDPFFTTRKNGGTGLGLWITRQLIEKNGGAIQVSTSTATKNHGTTMTISFPIRATHDRVA